MKTTRPDLAFERMLGTLERDLLDATDEEILAAAKELGMNPGMKGSAAFIGVLLLARPRSRPTETGEMRVSPRARRRQKDDAPPT
jgi:hypothetical protein